MTDHNGWFEQNRSRRAQGCILISIYYVYRDLSLARRRTFIKADNIIIKNNIKKLRRGGGWWSSLCMVFEKNICQDWCANLYMVFNIIYNFKKRSMDVWWYRAIFNKVLTVTSFHRQNDNIAEAITHKPTKPI